MVEVDGPRVTLGDLFENAGAAAALEVLDAPLPGARLRLSLAQAFELANAGGLGWRPLAPFDTVTVTRAWRYLDGSEIVDELKAALQAAGAGTAIDLDLNGAALKVKVARGALAEIWFENVEHDPVSGRFAATMVIRSAGKESRTSLFGRARITVEVPALRVRLRPGDVIRAEDLETVRLAADRVPRGAITEMADLVGKSPRRTVTPGKPLTARDVGRPRLILKGAMVAMHYVTRSMHIVVAGRALKAGALGDVIQVQNLDSRIGVDAVVTGTNRTEVRTAAQIAQN